MKQVTWRDTQNTYAVDMKYEVTVLMMAKMKKQFFWPISMLIWTPTCVSQFKPQIKSES